MKRSRPNDNIFCLVSGLGQRNQRIVYGSRDMTGTPTAIVAHRFWRRTLNRETNSSTYGIASVTGPSLVTPETVHHSLTDSALLTKRSRYSTIMASAHGPPSPGSTRSSGSADCTGFASVSGWRPRLIFWYFRWPATGRNVCTRYRTVPVTRSRPSL